MKSKSSKKRFSDLTDTALAVLLRSDMLQLDEIDILEKVKKWAKTNAISSGQSARKVSLLSTDNFKKVFELGLTSTPLT